MPNLDPILSQACIFGYRPVDAGHTKARSRESAAEYNSVLWIADLQGSAGVTHSLQVSIETEYADVKGLSRLIERFVSADENLIRIDQVNIFFCLLGKAIPLSGDLEFNILRFQRSLQF